MCTVGKCADISSTVKQLASAVSWYLEAHLTQQEQNGIDVAGLEASASACSLLFVLPVQAQGVRGNTY
jgi:hypothetical protein